MPPTPPHTNMRINKPTPPKPVHDELIKMGFGYVASWMVGQFTVHSYMSIKLGEIEYNETMGQMVFHARGDRPTWSVNYHRTTTGCWNCDKTTKTTHTSGRDTSHDDLIKFVKRYKKR